MLITDNDILDILNKYIKNNLSDIIIEIFDENNNFKNTYKNNQVIISIKYKDCKPIKDSINHKISKISLKTKKKNIYLKVKNDELLFIFNGMLNDKTSKDKLEHNMLKYLFIFRQKYFDFNFNLFNINILNESLFLNNQLDLVNGLAFFNKDELIKYFLSKELTSYNLNVDIIKGNVNLGSLILSTVVLNYDLFKNNDTVYYKLLDIITLLIKDIQENNLVIDVLSYQSTEFLQKIYTENFIKQSIRNIDNDPNFKKVIEDLSKYKPNYLIAKLILNKTVKNKKKTIYYNRITNTYLIQDMFKK